jgi:CheY-like chemotaxis protein
MTQDRKPEDLELDELQYTVLIDKQANVLVVDDEPTILKLFESILAETELNVTTASGGQEALDKIEAGDFNLVVIDKNMPVIDGMEVIRQTKASRPEIEFIVITAYASYESAVESLRLGAFDYIEKPLSDLKLVREKIAKGIEKQQLAHENSVLAEHLRETHKDLSTAIEKMGKSIDDVDKVNVYMRTVINKSTRELKVENTLLKRALSSIETPIVRAQEMIKDIAKIQDLPSLFDVLALLERANSRLSDAGPDES